MFSRYFSIFVVFMSKKLASYCFILYLCRINGTILLVEDEKTFYITICTFDNLAFCYGSGYYIWYYRCGDG